MPDAIRTPSPLFIPLNAPHLHAEPALAQLNTQNVQPIDLIGEDVIIHRILRELNMADALTITQRDIQQTRNLIAAHQTTPTNVLKVLRNLNAAPTAQTEQETPGSMRRLALAAMLGVVVGFNCRTAQHLVDEARNKPMRDVAAFVAQEMAVAGIVATGVYGCVLAGARGCAGVASKGALIKGGGLTVKGCIGAAAGVVGWGFVTVAAASVSFSIVRGGIVKFKEIKRENEHLFEQQILKDQRILAGLKEGHLRLPNRAPTQPQRDVVNARH